MDCFACIFLPDLCENSIPNYLLSGCNNKLKLRRPSISVLNYIYEYENKQKHTRKTRNKSFVFWGTYLRIENLRHVSL